MSVPSCQVVALSVVLLATRNRRRLMIMSGSKSLRGVLRTYWASSSSSPRTRKAEAVVACREVPPDNRRVSSSAARSFFTCASEIAGEYI